MLNCYSKDHMHGVVDSIKLLNLVRAGHRPAYAWFLEIVSMQTSVCVCMFVFVCPPPRLFITSGVMWRDMDSI